MTTPALLPALSLGDVTKLLKRVSGSGGNISARCPVPEHKDTRASLSVSQGRNGIVIHCHAGCTPEAVCAALGIELKQLFPIQTQNGQNGTTPRREIAAVYDYQDADGKLRYQVVRYLPKDFRVRQPDGPGWKWNLQGVERILYRLPGLIEGIALGRTVYIVEGEKDADRLIELGLTATTCVGGADKWRDEYNQYLASADVIVLPDNDPAGRSHAERIGKALTGGGK